MCGSSSRSQVKGPRPWGPVLQGVILTSNSVYSVGMGELAFGGNLRGSLSTLGFSFASRWNRSNTKQQRRIARGVGAFGTAIFDADDKLSILKALTAGYLIYGSAHLWTICLHIVYSTDSSRSTQSAGASVGLGKSERISKRSDVWTWEPRCGAAEWRNTSICKTHYCWRSEEGRSTDERLIGCSRSTTRQPLAVTLSHSSHVYYPAHPGGSKMEAPRDAGISSR